jgi:putative salt-induced outer membrane protein YdiY
MKQSRLFTFTATVSLLFSAVPAWSADVPPVGEMKTNKWESSAAAGLTLTRGNSSTLMATAAGATVRKWEDDELSFGADATYGKTRINGVSSENAESLHGSVQYNRLFTERLYGYARVEGLHDGIADITYRVTLSPGAGYYFIKEKTMDLSAEVGPGYVIEKLGHTTDDYATLRVAEKFHYQLSDHARLWQMAEWLPQVDDFDNYIINAEIGIEADLTKDKRLAMRSYLQDTYNNRPAANRQKNDAKLVTAIAYKF